nr:hypothetical protein [Oceanicaulis sp. HTCC2633]
MVRKRPTADQRVTLTGAAGSWDDYRGEVDASSPLNDSGTLRGRVVTSYQGADTGLAVVLQGLVRPRLRGTELEFWRNSEEARTDRPSQQLRSLNGEWRLMRYFLLTHLCGISHRIWCTLSTICSDAA